MYNTDFLVEESLSVISLELLKLIKQRYTLNLHGTHGLVHWAKVHDNGKKLSEQEGVNRIVVEYFSVFHDSQRQNEYSDSEHGSQGANLAIELRDYIKLNDVDFELLLTACCYHTNAKTDDNITIQVCYDSDRLDLGRVGIKPLSELMCSPMGKEQESIEQAYKKGLDRSMPDDAFGLWKDDLDKMMGW